MATVLNRQMISEIRNLIHQGFSTRDDTLTPFFYVVSGSHLSGIAGPGSDIDVRGFHCADIEEYVKLHQPENQLELNMQVVQDSTTVDFVSYELREFGRRIAESHFNTVELLFADQVIINESTEKLRSLQAEYETPLPKKLSHRYLNMATSLLEKNQRTADDGGGRLLKEYLYSLRGALAARYVVEMEGVEPNLSILADQFLDEREREIVHSLTTHKVNGSDASIQPDTVAEFRDLIERQIDEIPNISPDERRTNDLRTSIDEWMLSIRREISEW